MARTRSAHSVLGPLQALVPVCGHRAVGVSLAGTAHVCWRHPAGSPATATLCSKSGGTHAGQQARSHDSQFAFQHVASLFQSFRSEASTAPYVYRYS